MFAERVRFQLLDEWGKVKITEYEELKVVDIPSKRSLDGAPPVNIFIFEYKGVEFSVLGGPLPA